MPEQARIAGPSEPPLIEQTVGRVQQIIVDPEGDGECGGMYGDTH